MSIYNKPDLKINIGCNTPSFHKKINSMNFSSSNTGRNQQENYKKYFSKNKLDLKHSQNISSENNIINYNNQQLIPSSSISKVLTSANIKNRRIEIDLNKNNSPNSSKFNKSVGDNTILFKHKQSTSQNNINNKIINYNINNAKEINHNKSKNSLNNINININISKKIISTYYNKSKDKKNLIVKKKSINSLNNSNKKEKNKFNQSNINNNNCSNNNNNNNNNKDDIKKINNENITKNQSERFFKKIQNNESNLINYYTNQSKNINNNTNNNNHTNGNTGNPNSLGYFSTNSNMSTNTNKNNYMNNSNIYMSNNNNININNSNNNNVNYTRDDIYNNYYSNRDRDRDINKKNYGNIFNKIIKENKSTCFSQIQSPVGINHTQGNINSIQNYLKYLNIGQKNKNYKNAPVISKNKAHKLSANNVYNHNNTESNIYKNNYNSGYNYETHTTFSQNNYNKLNDDVEIENDKIIPNLKNCARNEIKENKNKENKVINGCLIESPEELHYFYVKILQKGKKVNFDKNNQ